MTLAGILAVVGLGALALKVFLGRSAHTFDAGAVSQSWLSEHRADTPER